VGLHGTKRAYQGRVDAIGATGALVGFDLEILGELFRGGDRPIAQHQPNGYYILVDRGPLDEGAAIGCYV
jgi:hypothetical protein